jgi:anthranilate/para-aminobenzoate synthase component I
MRKDADPKQLSEDQKENSEHVMLVDLARNDLSRNGHDVQVEKYREVQFFACDSLGFKSNGLFT